MRYEITRTVLGRPPALSIDENAFLSIRNANTSLFRLLQIEEDYDILISNYVDLERVVLSLGVESFVHRRNSRLEIDQDRRLLNRLIANLLAAARAFTDHTKHHVSRMAGPTSSDVDLFNNLFSAEYDKSKSYRVIEALRNYAQHCGLPAQSLAYKMWRRGSQGAADDKLLSSISPSLSIKYLQADPQFKKGVLEELASTNEKYVPLMPLVREYVGSLSSIQEELRRHYASRKEQWRQTLDDWISQYVAFASDTQTAGLAAFSIGDSEEVAEEIYLGAEFGHRIEALQKANKRLTGLHKLEVVN